MNYIKQIMWIILFTFLGEFLSFVLPLPVPAGVYGLVLLFIALGAHIVKLPDIEGAGNFLLDTMTMMFLPATVGIMAVADKLMPVLAPFITIVVISTIFVMLTAGETAQLAMKRLHVESDDRPEEESSEEVHLDPVDTYGIGRRPLSPNGEMDGANGYAGVITKRRLEDEKEETR